jgi:hypothetical protein
LSLSFSFSFFSLCSLHSLILVYLRRLNGRFEGWGIEAAVTAGTAAQQTVYDRSGNSDSKDSDSRRGITTQRRRQRHIPRWRMAIVRNDDGGSRGDSERTPAMAAAGPY